MCVKTFKSTLKNIIKLLSFHMYNLLLLWTNKLTNTLSTSLNFLSKLQLFTDYEKYIFVVVNLVDIIYV